MPNYKRLCATFALLALMPQSAIPADLQWVKFSDPAENSFSYEVPAGWPVKGGITRKSPFNAKAWMNLSSPDNAIHIFFGDPEVEKHYFLPDLIVKDTGLAGNATAYWSADKFAKMYAQIKLTERCSNVQFIDVQMRPEVIEQISAMHAKYPQFAKVKTEPKYDSALARFNCIVDKRAYIAGQFATIALYGPADTAGTSWSVISVQSYLTPIERESEALQIVGKIRKSGDINPQWMDAMVAATRQHQQELKDAQATPQSHGGPLIEHDIIKLNAELLRQRHQATMQLLDEQRKNNNVNVLPQQQ